jgi:hypothetical protein
MLDDLSVAGGDLPIAILRIIFAIAIGLKEAIFVFVLRIRIGLHKWAELWP